nr:excalibur calcium-binding domain-containing protein [Mycolicibacterium komanii]CRL68256.1 Excalibur domain-containing protein [Mycolicibacterium komanii]
MIKTFVVAAFVVTAPAIGLAPAALADGPYANCSAAHADGRYDIPQGDPDYWDGGDRDHDGIACES